MHAAPPAPAPSCPGTGAGRCPPGGGGRGGVLVAEGKDRRGQHPNPHVERLAGGRLLSSLTCALQYGSATFSSPSLPLFLPPPRGVGSTDACHGVWVVACGWGGGLRACMRVRKVHWLSLERPRYSEKCPPVDFKNPGALKLGSSLSKPTGQPRPPSPFPHPPPAPAAPMRRAALLLRAKKTIERWEFPVHRVRRPHRSPGAHALGCPDPPPVG